MTDTTSTVSFYNKQTVDRNALRDNQIILSTLNAKYIHASLGLRYLHANMGQLQACTSLDEFTINQRTADIAEKLVAQNPDIIGFGVYIWNIRQTTDLIALIKTIAPNITVVIGGPEVSYEYQQTTIFEYCDHLITGQADFEFRRLCEILLSNSEPDKKKVFDAIQPPVNQLESPYHLYTDDDLANRILYVEASRGCPFKCEFCLSALDKTAWPFALPDFLSDMEILFNRGARQFKFVDRTFNLKVKSCIEILDFFLERLDDNLFLHFEVIPDKLPDELKTALQKFPPSALQFEVGIQSFNPAVQETISRRQDDASTVANLKWLRQNTNAYIHADLIFGLPGETLKSFADGFNRLAQLDPHEIQVGILKRLRGTNISRHTDEFQMVYSPDAPYQLLANRDIDFPTIQKLQRFARYWDLIGNSSRFKSSLPLLLKDNPFDRFWRLSEWLFEHSGQTHRISLLRLFALLNRGCSDLDLCNKDELIQALRLDYQRTGDHRLPRWLTSGINDNSPPIESPGHHSRQSRHAKTEGTLTRSSNAP